MGNLLIVAFYRLPQLFFAANPNPATDPNRNTPCPGGGFFGLPPWYKYLKSIVEPSNIFTSTNPVPGGPPVSTDVCTPYIGGLTDFLLIGLAVLEMLLRVAALVAIVFVVIGGFKYITSQAEPDKLKAARGTIISAIIGLVIAVGATSVITFVAGRF